MTATRTIEDYVNLERCVDALEDELVRLRKDAARYRWLRDTAYHATAGPNGKMVWCVTGEGCSTEEPIYGEALDAAIDATMKTPNVQGDRRCAASSRSVQRAKRTGSTAGLA